jgi:hypothetical protein
MTSEEVRHRFRQVLDEQPDIGAAKIISDWFFEPTQIFDPAARKRLKPEILMVLIYIVLMAAVCAALNWT